jgi:hypothetical protein
MLDAAPVGSNERSAFMFSYLAGEQLVGSENRPSTRNYLPTTLTWTASHR